MVATIINWWTKIIICYVVATIINWWTENNKFIYGCSQFSFLIFFLSLFSQIFICIEVFVFVCNCSLFSKQCHKAVSSWAKSQSHLGYNLSRGMEVYCKLYQSSNLSRSMEVYCKMQGVRH